MDQRRFKGVFLIMLLVWLLGAGLAWEQIERICSSGRFQSWRERSTSVKKRPARYLPLVTLSFMGDSRVTILYGWCFVLFFDDQRRLL